MARNAERGATGVNLGLIITPMLDMSFQILAFFIMTYHPSALEGHIPGSLAPRPVALGPATGPPPIEVGEPLPPDELSDTVTVIVETDGGQPGKVYLKQKAEPVPRQIADAHDTWAAARQALGIELRRLRQDADGARIRIEPAGGLHQEFVMSVYDVCRQSGFTTIDFVPPPLNRLAGR